MKNFETILLTIKERDKTLKLFRRLERKRECRIEARTKQERKGNSFI